METEYEDEKETESEKGASHGIEAEIGSGDGKRGVGAGEIVVEFLHGGGFGVGGSTTEGVEVAAGGEGL